MLIYFYGSINRSADLRPPASSKVQRQTMVTRQNSTYQATTYHLGCVVPPRLKLLSLVALGTKAIPTV